MTTQDIPQLDIRNAEAADEASWRKLWAGYNDFYQSQVPTHVTAETWRRILDPASTIASRLAVLDGTVVGFATHLLHEGTWTTTPMCYLEDLFVEPGRRGTGIGRALIQDLLDLARDSGWSRVYWHTQSGNPARKLYDEFTRADDFVRYVTKLDGTKD
jgi:GNAT superfamily N-acetyltransferase